MAITVSAPTAAARTLYYVHTDHLDTPRLVANQAGVTVWRWDNREPFGVTPADEDPDANGTPFVFNLRFAGQYFDRESGLHYNRYRDYDPVTGRYVQTDPIGLAGGISLYAYVSGSPLSAADPLGLLPTPLNATGFTTYGLFDPGATTPYYVGHTGQTVDARLAEHISSGRATSSTRIDSLTGAKGDLTYTQSKGYEQAYMESYETKTGGRGKRINSVDTSRTDKRGKSHISHYKKKSAELKNDRCR